jgi:hypothetical protein
MSLAAVSRGPAVVATALLIALAPRVVAAEPAGSDAEAPAPGAVASVGPPKSGPLVVWVDAAGAAFDRARLQTSLAHELAREVVLTEDATAAAVEIRLDDAAHANVRYTTPGGERLTRRVDLPPDHERAVQVVSWLTVNLVRDEASELLDELRARRKEEAAARAAADKAAADKAAADKAAAEAARRQEEAKPAAKRAARDELLREPLRSIDAALATPMSVLRDSPKRELHLQLALAYGESGAINGIAVAPGVLRMRHDLSGIAVGTAAVFVGGNARGIMTAAGYSQLDGNLDGVQIGGGAAVQRGKYARGAVVALGGAIAGKVNGALVGGGFASAPSLRGAAASIGFTWIRGPSEGVLVAGGANFSAEHRGIEVAAVNTARELQGIALGSINVHRRVKGLQIGLVNVAEQVDGGAIGILSFAKNGRVQPVLWTAIDGSVHVAIKSIVGYAFTQLGAGIDLAESKLSYDGGVGAHLRVGSGFFLEPGVHYSASQVTADTADASGTLNEQHLHYLAQVGLRVGNKVDLLAAAGVRHTIAGDSGAVVAPELRAGIGFF